MIGSSVRSFGDALRDVFGNDFKTWSFAVNVSYPIGTSIAEAAVAQTKLQQQQQHTTLADLEMQVTTQVREAGRNVNTNLKRVEATRKARELAEQPAGRRREALRGRPGDDVRAAAGPARPRPRAPDRAERDDRLQPVAGGLRSRADRAARGRTVIGKTGDHESTRDTSFTRGHVMKSIGNRIRS